MAELFALLQKDAFRRVLPAEGAVSDGALFPLTPWLGMLARHFSLWLLGPKPARPPRVVPPAPIITMHGNKPARFREDPCTGGQHFAAS